LLEIALFGFISRVESVLGVGWVLRSTPASNFETSYSCWCNEQNPIPVLVVLLQEK
jgi:hypothetical protein